MNYDFQTELLFSWRNSLQNIRKIYCTCDTKYYKQLRLSLRETLQNRKIIVHPYFALCYLYAQPDDWYRHFVLCFLLAFSRGQDLFRPQHIFRMWCWGLHFIFHVTIEKTLILFKILMYMFKSFLRLIKYGFKYRQTKR